MQMQNLDALIERSNVKSLSIRRLLASIHRGDPLTIVSSKVLKTLVWISLPIMILAWLITWLWIYYELERWTLVLAFVDQFFRLGINLVILRITYIRASHLAQLPPGPFVSLRAVGLLLRWLGECILILSIGSLLQALLGSPLGLLASSPETSFALDFLKPGFKLFSLAVATWMQLVGFLTFAGLYAAAGSIDLFIEIEKNTRTLRTSTLRTSRDHFGHGTEA